MERWKRRLHGLYAGCRKRAEEPGVQQSHVLRRGALCIQDQRDGHLMVGEFRRHYPKGCKLFSLFLLVL